MNFLAHALLSGPSPDILVGNFMGDFVKGKKYQDYPADIARGILLHREIDFFTDKNAFVKKSKNKFRPVHGHFAGVIVDVVYDHLLVNNWTTYSQVDLKIFIDRVYQVLQDYFDLLPLRLQQILPNMIQYNWLFNYGYTEGVKRALRGMSRRSRFNPAMETAVEELQTHYTAFNKEFNQFFPQVIQMSRQYIRAE
ncbi:MAG: ACP phosphodiesterase [Candidatus Cyclobacteriaceae bacterium M3_2C_046]